MNGVTLRHNSPRVGRRREKDEEPRQKYCGQSTLKWRKKTEKGETKAGSYREAKGGDAAESVDIGWGETDYWEGDQNQRGMDTDGYLTLRYDLLKKI